MLFFSIFCYEIIAKSSNDKLPDSLVLISDLEFDNNVEEKHYYQLFENNQSAFEVLMSLNSGKSEKEISLDKQMLEFEVNKLKQIPFNEKKKAKYLKEVYGKIHDRFLEKYELQNNFNDIFKNGNYNCVSACAIYAFTLDKLNIPYTIKETPTHVYIVAYPDSEQFLIETTDPLGGFNKFSDNFKSSFVKLLLDTKTISQSDFDNNDFKVLFDKYYFTNIDLDIKKLTGIQYLNEGLYKLQENEFHKAVKNLEKAYLLYPHEKVYQSLLYGYSSIISNGKYDDFGNVKTYAKLTRFPVSVFDDESLKNEFIRITLKTLIEEGNLIYYDSVYQYLSKNIARISLKEEADFIYNYERGRVLFTKGEYNKAIKFLDMALILKPGNANIEAVFLSCLGYQLENESDEKKILNILKEKLDAHKILEKNNHFGGMYLNATLIQMADSFYANKYNKGAIHEKSFKSIFEDHPNYLVEKDLIGRAYSQKAVYYFRKGYYSKAKLVIKEGLKMAPHSYELKSRLMMIDN